MKKKLLIVVGVIVAAVVLYFYVKSLKEDYYIDGNEGIVLVPEDGIAPKRVTLDQNWDEQTRKEFWYTSQGSEIMPYSWFTWLEQPDNSQLFRNTEHMSMLGYLPEPTSELNPSGLPIGFAITRARANKERGFGFTCAACHTNQIDYNGVKMLVEGAPTLANFVGFYSRIVGSLEETHTNEEKFERFAQRVLADKYSASTASDLKNQVKELALATAERQAVNALPDDYPADFTSYGRLDAFGNIMNAGSAFGLHDLANRNSPTGPVSYPFLWGTHQSDVVQWNASAANTPVVGPLVRNIGEVVGVFGGLSIHPAPWWQQLIGVKIAYSSTVDFRGLGELESWIMDMRSPEWPEQYLTEIDDKKAARGAIIYDSECKSCHQVIKREDEGDPYVSNKTLLTELGTDPITAWNIQNYKAKTLILEGQKADIVLGDPFGVETSAIEIPINGVVGVVLKRPITAIKAGLIPAKHAGIEADVATLEKLLAEHLEKNNEIASSQNDPSNNKVAPSALGPNAPAMDLDSLVYKGRPLNGIWATAPYLHNGSIPNLWELLVAPEDRVDTFWVGSHEFDPENVGFVTSKGKSLFRVYKNGTTTIMPGNSNLGHDWGTGLEEDQKWDLIEYMKTL
ncbi:MAG: di-heme-cytochrome C peroxidase [Saprospiraceae bacterium]|nr:di-heme-cytochrome C peroxidase [Saprospiraceae bacterium]